MGPSTRDHNPRLCFVPTRKNWNITPAVALLFQDEPHRLSKYLPGDEPTA
jgi:hypothetical protein